MQNESSLTKESEEKVFTTSATGTTVPKNTQVTTTTHNLQASKYNKGRSTQSQSRSTRDGYSNNSYHRYYILLTIFNSWILVTKIYTILELTISIN